MKAKVTTAFPGRRDDSGESESFPVGAIIEGDLAQVAVNNGWAVLEADAELKAKADADAKAKADADAKAKADADAKAKADADAKAKADADAKAKADADAKAKE